MDKPHLEAVPALGIQRDRTTELAAGSSPLRGREAIRRMLQRDILTAADLCMPMLIVEDDDVARTSVPTFTLGQVGTEVSNLAAFGVGAVKFFAGSRDRDRYGSDATDPDSLMNRSIEIAKEAAPDLAVMTENCLCSYTADRICYVPTKTGALDYAATLEALVTQANQQAMAGADVVGPAGMLDGAVTAVRAMLDECGFANVAIMPHVIFTSRLYDGYRQAMKAVPRSGNRAAFQIHPSLPAQAVELSLRLVDEGADMILLEPAAHTIDILIRLAAKTTVPLVPFSVSGEHLQLTHNGRLDPRDYREVLLERLTMFKRSGAAMLVTYAAREAAQALAGNPVAVTAIPAARRAEDGHAAA